MMKGRDYMASIIKRKYTYSVGYNIKKENNDTEVKWEVYYDYSQAVKRKEELDNGEDPLIISVNAEMNVAYYLTQFCNVYGLKNWSLSTYQTALSVTVHYLTPLTKNLSIGEITRDNAKEIYKRLENSVAISSKGGKRKKIPHSMLYKADLVLRCAFDYVTTQGIGNENPFLMVRKPIIKGNTNRSTNWKSENLIEMINQCNHCYLFLLMHLVFGCNLYIKEALAITWNDIHLDMENIEESRIHIINEFNRYDLNALSKIDQEDIVKIYPPTYSSSSTTRKAILKLRGSAHTAYIPNKIVTILQLLKERYDVLKNTNREFNDDGLLFCRNDGYPYEVRVIEKEFIKLRNKFKLPNVRLSTLRSFGKDINNITEVYKNLNDFTSLPIRQGETAGIYSIKQERHIKYKELPIAFKNKNDIDIPKLEQKLKESPELLEKLAKLLDIQ